MLPLATGTCGAQPLATSKQVILADVFSHDGDHRQKKKNNNVENMLIIGPPDHFSTEEDELSP